MQNCTPEPDDVDALAEELINSDLERCPNEQLPPLPEN